MIRLFQSKKELLRKMAELESRVIERERKNALDERLALIDEYENKIISEAEKAAKNREEKMLEIISAKDNKITELELELSKLRSSYRDFKDDIHNHEVLVDKTRNKLYIAKETISQLYGMFEGIGDAIERSVTKIDKKDRKLIEKGEG